MNYSQELSNLPFYRLHPSYLPFVGDDYDKYRILQISESHYVDDDLSHFGIGYFESWYDEDCPDVEVEILENNMTRKVCNRVLSGERYHNFDNPLRSFRSICLGKDAYLNADARKDYSYFAFMNFYQFPAFRSKGSFQQSLFEQGQMEGNIDAAQSLLAKSQRFSVNLVDEVIDVIQPKLIMFTSFDAGDAYQAMNGKYSKSEKTLYLSHPNNLNWYRHYSRLDYKRSIDIFEEKLKNLF